MNLLANTLDLHRSYLHSPGHAQREELIYQHPGLTQYSDKKGFEIETAIIRKFALENTNMNVYAFKTSLSLPIRVSTEHFR